MTKLLFIKLLKDMRTVWGRIVMMVVAISLSLVLFSAMLYALTLVQSNMTSGYMSTSPASARITLKPGVAPDQIETILNEAKSEPGVIDATMRSVISLKLQKDGNDSSSLQLFVAAPDDPMKIATFNFEQGAWSPPKDGILIERSALNSLNVKIGDTITLTSFYDKPVEFKIIGVVRDQSLAPAGSEGGAGYISTDSLPLLGRPPQLNQLAITVSEQPGQTIPSRNRDTIVSTALQVAKKLKATGNVEIEQVAVPPPYEHPHQGIANALLGALLAFGALSLLLSAILIATMLNGLLTQHISQIGIMKAIGANTSRILQLYGTMVLVIVVAATALAFLPGLFLGRALAQLLLNSALNIDVTSLAVPLWVYATTIAAGILIPLLIALPPLLQASRRTVREALDDRGVVEDQGHTIMRLYSWLGRLEGIDRILLMAFRNLFRRQARFLLSVGLLAVAGAIFVGGLNLMAGFQAIPKIITDAQRWDVQIRLSTPSDTNQLKKIVENVPGITAVETWNSTTTGIQYPGEINVTRTYPDQGHGLLGLSALPPNTTMFTTPYITDGRWLSPSDTDAIVLPQTIRKTLPDVKVGSTIQLPIEDQVTTWRVVGMAEEVAGGACPCVTQKGFEQAINRPNQANLVRITTDRHDKQSRIAIGKETTLALQKASIKAQNAQPLDSLLESAEGHSGILIYLIMLVAIAIGAVGLMGLGSAMSTSVIERTREFGVMSAIGARPAMLRRLVVFEGIFIALVSSVAAAIPAMVLTQVMSVGLGNLFFSAPVPFQISTQAIIIWIIVVTLGATVATLAPAYRASRLTVREALAYL